MIAVTPLSRVAGENVDHSEEAPSQSSWYCGGTGRSV